MGDPSDSSSGEEDGDAAWRAAIDSVATATSTYVSSIINGSSDMAAKRRLTSADDGNDRRNKKLKHYQIKAQKLLNEILEESLVMVKDHPINEPVDDTINEGVIRLFKNSNPGIELDPTEEPQEPRKRPKILPGKEIDEKSKKFKKRLQSVTVDGEDIMAASRKACQKSLARMEAKEAAAKEAAKREEERVAQLKKIRGERWLPSLAREMQMKFPT
ncbi:uncharacterized protein LOC115715169 [Cannabis sativa]|uniref:Uncharacterized protein n=1 Tax=Cannabis sativa TaxID=3483 RepID=A0A7J6FWX9_CANSA|nr:uncharacterized protein LOC115715169 [Cannabis sativa]KAF4375142.1 hypothetical protein F8388_017288 [Cannabis sativa]KAF4402038.1 hypothetical protein G4B88_017550 [Cannabis sativa]